MGGCWLGSIVNLREAGDGRFLSLAGSSHSSQQSYVVNMVAATTNHHSLFDPWSRRHAHFSAAETTSLLELLQTDYLVDSHAKETKEKALLQDLLAVDIQFHRVEVRDHENVATAPELKEQKDIFLDLLAVDQEIDQSKHSAEKFVDQHYSSTTALHDPYVRKDKTFIQEFVGIYAPNIDGARGSSPEELLRDNATMIELLAVDDSVDDHKRLEKLLHSSEYGLIEDLYEIDTEVSAAKRRVLLTEDLQDLLDVDHLVDGKTPAASNGHMNGQGVSKRSIFSHKEKYHASLHR
jgi:hypothetical protein